MKLKVLVLALSSLLAVEANAQKASARASEKKIVEAKIRPLGLLFKSISVSSEFEVKENIGIEANVSYLWGLPFGNLLDDVITDVKFKTTAIGGSVNARYYINSSDKKLDKFYAGAYTSAKSSKITITYTDGSGNPPETASSTRLNFGFLAGYKIVSKDNKVTFDFTGGIGRAVVSKVKVDDVTSNEDDFNFGRPIDGVATFTVGYRF